MEEGGHIYILRIYMYVYVYVCMYVCMYLGQGSMEGEPNHSHQMIIIAELVMDNCLLPIICLGGVLWMNG